MIAILLSLLLGVDVGLFIGIKIINYEKDITP